MKPTAWLSVVVVALGLAGGCSTAPPIVVEGPSVTVRAHDKVLGRAVGLRAQGLAPRVRQLLGSTSELPEVWIVPSLQVMGLPPSAHATGVFVSEGPHAPLVVVEAQGGEAETSGVLGHELVHALLGPRITLPALLEEGLCDWVTSELVPEVGWAQVRLLQAAAYRPQITLLLEGQRLSGRVLLGSEHDPPPPPLSHLLGTPRARDLYWLAGDRLHDPTLARTYGAAFFLVRRMVGEIGVRVLLEKGRHRKGPLSADWVFGVAKIRDGAQLSREALVELASQGLLPAFLDWLHKSIGKVLIRDLQSSLTFEELLARRPVLTWQTHSIPLSACPALSQYLRDHWSAGS